MHYEVRFTVRLPEGVCATQREGEDWLRLTFWNATVGLGKAYDK